MAKAAGNRPRTSIPDRLTHEEFQEAQEWDEGPQDDDCPMCGAHETKVVEERPAGFPDFVYYQRIHQEDCTYVRYLNYTCEELILA